MKKGISILLATLLLLCLGGGASAVESVERYIEADNPRGFLQEVVLPHFEEDEQALLLFCAELNISNGNAQERKNGERYMFGRLLHSDHILDDYDHWATYSEQAWEETKRLLLGPWVREGTTNFSFGYRTNVDILNYQTGKWEKRDYVRVLHIEHITEQGANRRTANLSLEEDSLFSIVRKK